MVSRICFIKAFSVFVIFLLILFKVDFNFSRCGANQCSGCFCTAELELVIAVCRVFWRFSV